MDDIFESHRIFFPADSNINNDASSHLSELLLSSGMDDTLNSGYLNGTETESNVASTKWELQIYVEKWQQRCTQLEAKILALKTEKKKTLLNVEQLKNELHIQNMRNLNDTSNCKQELKRVKHTLKSTKSKYSHEKLRFEQKIEKMNNFLKDAKTKNDQLYKHASGYKAQIRIARGIHEKQKSSDLRIDNIKEFEQAKSDIAEEFNVKEKIYKEKIEKIKQYYKESENEIKNLKQEIKQLNENQFISKTDDEVLFQLKTSVENINEIKQKLYHQNYSHVQNKNLILQSVHNSLEEKIKKLEKGNDEQKQQSMKDVNLELKKNLVFIKNELSSCSKLSQTLQLTNNSLQSRITNFESEMKTLKTSNDAFQSIIIKSDDEIKYLQNNLEFEQEQHRMIIKQNNECMGKQETHIHKLKNDMQANKSLNSEIKQQKAYINQIEREIENHKLQFKHLEEITADKQMKLNENQDLKIELRKLTETIAKHAQEKESLQNIIDFMKTSSIDCEIMEEEKQQKLQKEIREKDHELHSLNILLNTKQNIINNMNDRKEMRNISLDETQNKLQQKTTEFTDYCTIANNRQIALNGKIAQLQKEKHMQKVELELKIQKISELSMCVKNCTKENQDTNEGFRETQIEQQKQVKKLQKEKCDLIIKVNKAKEDLTNIKKLNKKLRAETVKCSTNMKSLKLELTEMHSHKNNDNEQLYNLQLKYSDLKAEHSVRIKECKQLNDELQTVCSNLETSTITIQNTSSDCESKNAEIQALKSDVKVYKSEIKKLNANMNLRKKDLICNQKELQLKNDNLLENNEAMLDDITQLQQANIKLLEKVEKMDELEDNLRKVESDQFASQSEIQRLKHENETLQTFKSKLSKKYNERQSELKKHEQMKTDQSRNSETLQTDILQLKSENNALKKKNKQKTINIESIEHKMQKSNESLNKLHSREMKVLQKSHTKEYQRLQQEYDKILKQNQKLEENKILTNRRTLNNDRMHESQTKKLHKKIKKLETNEDSTINSSTYTSTTNTNQSDCSQSQKARIEVLRAQTNNMKKVNQELNEKLQKYQHFIHEMNQEMNIKLHKNESENMKIIVKQCRTLSTNGSSVAYQPMCKMILSACDQLLCIIDHPSTVLSS